MDRAPEEEHNYIKNNPHIFYSPLDPKFAKNYNKYIKNIEDHTYITCNHCNMKVQRRSMPRHLTSKRCLIKQLILDRIQRIKRTIKRNITIRIHEGHPRATKRQQEV